MTFKLPNMAEKKLSLRTVQVTSPSELCSSTPHSATWMEDLNIPEVIEEDRELEVDEIEEAVSPEEPPLSPISSAISKARFSKLDVHGSIRRAIDNVNIITEHPAAFHARAFSTPFQMERAATAPSGLHRQYSIATIATVKTTRSVPLSMRSTRAGGSSSRGAGIRLMASIFRKRNTGARFSGIDKDVTAAKRSSALSKRRAEIGPAEAEALSPTSPGLPAPVQRKATILPWRGNRKGETMSMLLDSGFFPVEEYIYKEEKEKKLGTKSSKSSSKGRLALKVLTEHETSSRPSSITGTPTEFYHRGLPQPSPRRHIRGSIRRNHYTTPRRRLIGQLNSPTAQRESIIANALALSPLSPLALPKTPSTPSSALATLNGGYSFHIAAPEVSPGILEVISEDGGASETVDSLPVILEQDDTVLITEEPRNVSPSVPVKTEIHLISGTVVTVVPPELTCWTRSRYIQGPIKLPTPAVAPRKDSIASLAPFQDAVETIYDQALHFSRRESEDQVMDDLLEWYDNWDYPYPSYDFDMFKENVDFRRYSHDSDYEDDVDSPGPMERALAARMLSVTGRVPRKASAMLGLTSNNIALPSITPSSTKARFSLPGSRKSSLASSRRLSAGSRKHSGHGRKISGGSTSSYGRKESGYALSTLDEYARPLTVFNALASMRKTSEVNTGSTSRRGSPYALATLDEDELLPISPHSTSFYDHDFGVEDECTTHEPPSSRQDGLAFSFYTPVETSVSASSTPPVVSDPPTPPPKEDRGLRHQRGQSSYYASDDQHNRPSAVSTEPPLPTPALPHAAAPPSPPTRLASPTSIPSTICPISVLPQPPSSASNKIIDWGTEDEFEGGNNNEAEAKKRESKEGAGWWNKLSKAEKRERGKEEKARVKADKKRLQAERDAAAMPKVGGGKAGVRAAERVVVMY